METGDGWLRAGFATIYPAHVAAFVSLMRIIRHGFDGDLDQMLIPAVIGEHKLARRADTGQPRLERLDRTEIADTGTAAIDAHSLSDFTGIPRETVRRKVAALLERGWVRRDVTATCV